MAEAGSIARAGGGDPVRQSQYSRQLKELEEYFETELTRRQGKILALTPAGERLARIVRENFRQLGDFAAESAGEPVVYAIGAGESLIHWLILPRIGGLRVAVPNVRLRVRNMRTTDVIRELGDLRLDFGVVRRGAVPRQFKAVTLGRMGYALYVPAALHPKPQAVRYEDLLCTLPLALLAGEDDFNRHFHAAAEKAGVELNEHLRCESFPQAAQAVAIGTYAAVLPTLARMALPDGQVWELNPSALKALAREVVLVWNPRVTRLRSVAARVQAWLGKTLRF